MRRNEGERMTNKSSWMATGMSLNVPTYANGLKVS